MISHGAPFTVEMIEFIDGRPSPMRPLLGTFPSLAEANKVAMLRIFFGAPNLNRVGFHVFDRNRREVSAWQPGSGFAVP